MTQTSEIMNNRVVGEARTDSNALAVRIQKQVSAAFALDVDFIVQPGINILFGGSGAGKTTLLDCVAGLMRPDSGRVIISGRPLFESEKGVDVPVSKRNIGYVFQDLALFPHLDVEANVAYGLFALSVDERKERVAQVLDAMGISALSGRRPAALSGGERQRVALARSLVTRPSILLLDEPLAGLDLPARMKIADDLRRLFQQSPIPVVYVTHSRDEVFVLGEHLLVVEHGRLIAQGRPHEVLSAPRVETIAQLAGFENIVDCVVASLHEDRGTMSCRLMMSPSSESSHQVAGAIELETPLVRADVGDRLRVGISAGDILLATSAPIGLSARNVLPGRLVSMSQRDAIIVARVDCGVELSVHLTLGTRDSLKLVPGAQVWVIVKTHSCHLLSQSGP